jgi:hypothetical protein
MMGMSETMTQIKTVRKQIVIAYNGAIWRRFDPGMAEAHDDESSPLHFDRPYASPDGGSDDGSGALGVPIDDASPEFRTPTPTSSSFTSST